MDTLTQRQQQQEGGTSVRQFLARRGAVLVKETRDIGRSQGLYRDSLMVSTAVLAFVKGQHKDMSFGIRIERQDVEERTDSSVYLDFDEIPELVDAFDFIKSSAVRMAEQQLDYTEVTYSTKDGAKIGFFQNAGKQQYFIHLEPHRDMSFLSDLEFQRLKLLLLKAKEHLLSRGASVA